MMDVEPGRESSCTMVAMKPLSQGGTAMKGKTFKPTDYEVFGGLDVDKRSISVTFTNHQGFIRSLRMPYSVEHLVNHVRKHFGDQKVAFAYEAGPTGYGLYDGLVAQDFSPDFSRRGDSEGQQSEINENPDEPEHSLLAAATVEEN